MGQLPAGLKAQLTKMAPKAAVKKKPKAKPMGAMGQLAKLC